MKRYSILLAGCALFAMSAPAAYADCAAEISELSNTAEGGEGIAKDGSLAPLQTEADAGATAETGTTSPAASDAAAGEGIAKDGSHVPLEPEGGTAAGVAMSEQDAQAQQEGKPTVAEQAAGATSTGRAGALEEAHAALAAGDEEACMQAVEKARQL